MTITLFLQIAALAIIGVLGVYMFVDRICKCIERWCSVRGFTDILEKCMDDDDDTDDIDDEIEDDNPISINDFLENLSDMADVINETFSKK